MVLAGDDQGASSAEYGLLIAGIAAVILAAVVVLGGTTSGLFHDTCASVASQTAADCD